MDISSSTILALTIGILCGVGLFFIINYIRGNQAEKKAKQLNDKAVKEAEKKRRDSLLELKEE